MRRRPKNPFQRKGMQPRQVSFGRASFAVADDKDTFWDRFDAGTWEVGTLSAIERLVRPGMVVIDIGAWVGPISLTAAALGATVIAVEPDARAFELLDVNIGANPSLKGRITPINKAAHVEKTRIHLASPKKMGDSMGSVLAVGRGRQQWEADTVTPAEIAALAGDADRILVKIDIEGGEYALLPALGPLLGPATVAALVAFHPRLMQGAGRSPADIEVATANATAALSEFDARTLDLGEPSISVTANSTVLFERRQRGR